MRDSVQLFNGQLEKLAELVLVMLVGAMLASTAPLPAVWWFVPLLLGVLRPLSVLPAILGERLSFPQAAMLGWFGIRGVGSVYYLLFALHRGLDAGIAATLTSLTLDSGRLHRRARPDGAAAHAALPEPSRTRRLNTVSACATTWSML